MNFGRNLHRLREIKEDTVSDVSAALGVSEDTYRSWESGEQEPWLNELCLLAKYFRLSIDNLVDECFDYAEFLRQLRLEGLI